MPVSKQRTPSPRSRLLTRVTCPHCWEKFPTETILWVAEHSDLLGDPKLGEEQGRRFLPTRFNVQGDALDAKGFACQTLACPRCHLPIPRCLLEMNPLFMSIAGAPASGKSFFLATMTWELRKILGMNFGMSFTDADPSANQLLNDYEASLFLNPESEKLMPLEGLIRKTETQGDIYDHVNLDGHPVDYPRPFVFSMQPQEDHPNQARSSELARVLCLYDNAGESFQVGQDTARSPVTRHLAQASVLFFLFDPTQDQRFRKFCQDNHDIELSPGRGGPSRQEPILQEIAVRVRRYAGLRHDEKHRRPLVVILTKFDAWSHLLELEDRSEPWREVKATAESLGPMSGEKSHVKLGKRAALNVSAIETRSQQARTLMRKLCPEIVNAAEAFAQNVVYVPVSALGWHTANDASSNTLSIRPCDTEPYWVTVPLLYAMARWMPGLIPVIQRKTS